MSDRKSGHFQIYPVLVLLLCVNVECYICQYIKPLDLNLDWCVAVEIIMGTKKCVIFNVYMPYQCSDNESSYLEKLGVIKAITNELDNTCNVITGDWNEKLRDIDTSMFIGHMLNFCSENNLKISSCDYLPINSYTYVSE